MPPYDDRLFVPPAPVLNARLRNPQSGTIVPEVRLLIDTGADVTLLQEVGILGRNILNTFALLLDGPHQSWSEHRGDRTTPR